MPYVRLYVLFRNPIREFLNTGLKVSINTDNRTVSNTTLTKELQFIQKTYGITDEEILILMKTPADILPKSTLYFQVYAMGSLGLVLYNT